MKGGFPLIHSYVRFYINVLFDISSILRDNHLVTCFLVSVEMSDKLWYDFVGASTSILVDSPPQFLTQLIINISTHGDT